MNLKPEYKEKLVQALSAFILVVLSIIGSMVADAITEIGEVPIDVSPIETPALDDVVALGTTHFTNLQAEDITATDDLTVTDDSTLTDDVAIGGDVTVTGSSTVGGTETGDLIVWEQTVLTATTTTITPTHTYYQLDSAAAVTITLAASATEGQLLVLLGDDANNITVADTNLRSHDGAALVVGQYDIAVLIYADSEWHQLIELANQ